MPQALFECAYVINWQKHLIVHLVVRGYQLAVATAHFGWLAVSVPLMFARAEYLG